MPQLRNSPIMPQLRHMELRSRQVGQPAAVAEVCRTRACVINSVNRRAAEQYEFAHEVAFVVVPPQRL